MTAPETIQDVILDVKGIGGVPDQQNISYNGFILWMRPNKFLELATPDSMNRDVSFFIGAINEGKPLAPPWVNLQWEDNTYSVTGHEGRGRVAAMIKYGITELIPVHCLGWRWKARDITQENIDSIKKGIYSERGNYIPSPAVKMVLSDKTYDLSSSLSRTISNAEQGATTLPSSQ